MHLAILGLGFIGNALAEHASHAGHVVDGFSRSRHLGGGARLDGRDPASVAAIGAARPGTPYDALVVTFPPQDATETLWPLVHRLARRRILLGSTSIYQRAPDCSEPVITEETPLEALHPRRPAEEAFLTAGGHVVRLAGLYGGERNPVRWIRSGKVGYEKRQINLVHRDDVADALLGLLGRPTLRPAYNLADGERHTWRQIIDVLVATGALEPLPPKPLGRSDAFVDPTALLTDLPGFAFRSLFEALPALGAEGADAGSAGG